VISKIPNCTFKVGDARSLPLHDSYLLLYLLWMPLNKFRDEVAIKEIQRVLIPNRHAILSGLLNYWFYRLYRFIEKGMVKVPFAFSYYLLYKRKIRRRRI
jgi:ubiquinone/menaquinone biosynthesis C-methylase UbiE